MGKRGPRPAPTALKLIQGTRSDRVNHDEPQPDPDAAAAIVCPQWLPPRAAAVWDDLAPDLIRKGVLTAWDVDTFAALCQHVVLLRDALTDLDEHGANLTVVDRELSDGTIVYRVIRNPNWMLARQATALLATVGGRFGLNPSDRSQLVAGGKRPDAPSTDDLLTG